MKTNEIVILALAIIAAALIIGGAIAITSNSSSSSDNITANTTENTTDSRTADAEVVKNDSDSDIVSEEIKFNYQNGSGYYKEITYRDGGFRQYDLKTGELIGSSYDSDQKYLPSLE